MCGRFQLFFKTAHLLNIIQILNEKGIANYHTGEIFPTNTVPVITFTNGVLDPTVMTWGFPNAKSAKVIINARSETVFEKAMFHHAIHTSRCVIPADGFFEWAKNTKYYFQNQEIPTMYMAGIYQVIDTRKCFVILTKKANDSICDIHHRMPVILSNEEVLAWLSPTSSLAEIMQKASPQLRKQEINTS